MTLESSNQSTSTDESKIPRRRSICGPCSYRPTLSSAIASKRRRRSSMPIMKKSVQFAETSEVKVVKASGINWYTLQDQERFKRERIIDLLLVKKYAKSGSSRVLETCPVGLEQFLSSKRVRDTKSNRREVIRLVLMEQWRQRTAGVNDPEQLARLSLMKSAEASVVAQKRGKFQEMAKKMHE
mmetsp:Transcript_29955/g.62774  ORF Transcript_29955/g.62774 Transcript_29955/m.62774 type:complete len:183 (-) Transcript_29955:165-713(-)|eukprot:CAMPEP_0171342002 /NCGR_PEP_ID=MMETSP0878-20121228/12839_1 /TAXON_ID=67004 /ORGANISM="Thalassiosira weissflogii, Strain CCMP1336" /LENGTH=182 /DNA_ID=CAMNT_0011844521 /DNA_START=15 /DNA_END=563 /DNA_ORIENTATION=+